MNKKKNFFLILFGYLISLFLLYITFKDVNFDKVFNYLSKINLLMVFFAIILNIFFVWVRGIYQKNNLYLTTPNIKLNTSIISVGIALFYNVILPTRLGDIVRAIFISLKDGDKPNIINNCIKLKSFGFNLICTKGTGNYLEKKGITVSIVNKVREGRPHVVDMIKNRDIDLIFNTTEGSQSIADSFSLRQAALYTNIPYYTTLSGCNAVVLAIENLKKQDFDIKSLQSY